MRRRDWSPGSSRQPSTCRCRDRCPSSISSALKIWKSGLTEPPLHGPPQCDARGAWAAGGHGPDHQTHGRAGRRDAERELGMGRLFGTDGARGVANVDLTPELVFRLGRAAAHVLSTDAGTEFLLGRDTRLSGPMLEAALTAAVCSAGGTVLSCGILPTPAVAYLTPRVAAPPWGVLSASHHPCG